MKYTVTQDFVQPASFLDVDIYLDDLNGVFAQYIFTLPIAGAYIIQAVDWVNSRILARRMSVGLGDAVTGCTVCAGLQGTVSAGMNTVASWSAKATGLGAPPHGSVGVGETTSVDGVHIAALQMRVTALEKELDMGKNKDKNLEVRSNNTADRAPWLVRAAAAQEMQELHQNLNQLKGLELADAINRAASLYYEEDPTVAGLVTAALECFPGDVAIYYASVVRYTGASGSGKTVVGSCKAPGLEAAIRGAGRAWLDALQAERRIRIGGSKEVNDEAQASLEELLGLSVEQLKEEREKMREEAAQEELRRRGDIFAVSPKTAMVDVYDRPGGNIVGQIPANALAPGNIPVKT